MTRGLLLQIHKEVRALLPGWLGLVAVLAMAWGLQHSGLNDTQLLRLQVLSSAIYAFGAIGLGALSFGHEFSCRTLSGLLAQPASRDRLFIIKTAVLAGLLASLGLVASWIFPVFPQWRSVDGSSWNFWVQLLCGISLSPWFTMIGRGPLAGAVFACAFPVAAFVAGAYLRAPRNVVLLVIVIGAAVSGYLTWWTFRRLEATGDHQIEVHLVPWRTHGSVHAQSRGRNPWILLMSKELQLQQMTLALAGIFTSLWVAVWLVSTLASDLIPIETRYAITMLYGVLVSIMAGALASAEERRLGTLDWSLLLPFSKRAQWQIKAGVAIGLSVLLAFVLPAILQRVAPDPTITELFSPFLAVGLCIAALYVSSLSSSGVHATLAAAPAMGVAGAVALLASWPLAQLFAPLIQTTADWITPSLGITDPDWRWRQYPAAVGLAVGTVLILAFAGTNHGSTDHNRRTVMRQLTTIACLALVTLLAWMMIEAVLIEWMQLRIAASATASAR